MCFPTPFSLLFADAGGLSWLSFGGLDFQQVTIYVAIAVSACLLLGGLAVAATNRKEDPATPPTWLGRIAYFLFVITIGVLGATSLGSIFQFGHMAGYALLLHVGAAGGFVFLLLAVTWQILPRGRSGGETAEARWWLARWSAWGLVLSGLLTAGTMFASMLPVLDTQGLIQMAALHRYAGLAVLATALVHVYTLACTKLGWR